jgi:glycosyltransferase involved in cell wall biosynthesis
MTKTEAKILIFTKDFPFSREPHPFFDPELPHLDASFESIVLVPKQLGGKKKDLFPHIMIETTLGELIEPRRIIQYSLKTLLFFDIFSLDFYKEIIKKPKQTLHFSSFMMLILYLGDAIKTKKWVLRYIDRNNIDLAKTIFYTYWLDGTTLGLCLAKLKYPEMKVISRAHGYDLYDERMTFSYIPFRPEIFQNLNKVYTASLDGQQYLSNRYPLYKNIFNVANLGVRDPGFVTKQSDDAIFRIVSCSEMVPVKRLELLIYGLKNLGDLKKNYLFSWVHIGGPLDTKIEKFAEMTLPQNIECRFLGVIPNSDVINFYKNNPIDIFINVSQSEGLPVSIMEAQACGIPVIASAVGGNKEIINEKVGILLNADPTPEEIALGIINFMENPELIKERKYFSRINYEEKYDANKNFQLFAQELINIVQ